MFKLFRLLNQVSFIVWYPPCQQVEHHAVLRLINKVGSKHASRSYCIIISHRSSSWTRSWRIKVVTRLIVFPCNRMRITTYSIGMISDAGPKRQLAFVQVDTSLICISSDWNLTSSNLNTHSHTISKPKQPTELYLPVRRLLIIEDVDYPAFCISSGNQSARSSVKLWRSGKGPV